mgnify:CR=1 FL=1
MLTIRRTRRWTKKLKVIARQFQPSWLDERGELTREAQNIIKNELKDYLATGSVWLWVGEVKPEQSALGAGGEYEGTSRR